VALPPPRDARWTLFALDLPAIVTQALRSVAAQSAAEPLSSLSDAGDLSVTGRGQAHGMLGGHAFVCGCQFGPFQRVQGLYVSDHAFDHLPTALDYTSRCAAHLASGASAVRTKARPGFIPQPQQIALSCPPGVDFEERFHMHWLPRAPVFSPAPVVHAASAVPPLAGEGGADDDEGEDYGAGMADAMDAPVGSGLPLADVARPRWRSADPLDHAAPVPLSPTVLRHRAQQRGADDAPHAASHAASHASRAPSAAGGGSRSSSAGSASRGGPPHPRQATEGHAAAAFVDAFPDAAGSARADATADADNTGRLVVAGRRAVLADRAEESLRLQHQQQRDTQARQQRRAALQQEQEQYYEQQRHLELEAALVEPPSSAPAQAPVVAAEEHPAFLPRFASSDASAMSDPAALYYYGDTEVAVPRPTLDGADFAASTSRAAHRASAEDDMEGNGVEGGSNSPSRPGSARVRGISSGLSVDAAPWDIDADQEGASWIEETSFGRAQRPQRTMQGAVAPGAADAYGGGSSSQGGGSRSQDDREYSPVASMVRSTASNPLHSAQDNASRLRASRARSPSVQGHQGDRFHAQSLSPLRLGGAVEASASLTFEGSFTGSISSVSSPPPSAAPSAAPGSGRALPPGLSGSIVPVPSIEAIRMHVVSVANSATNALQAAADSAIRRFRHAGHGNSTADADEYGTADPYSETATPVAHVPENVAAAPTASKGGARRVPVAPKPAVPSSTAAKVPLRAGASMSAAGRPKRTVPPAQTDKPQHVTSSTRPAKRSTAAPPAALSRAVPRAPMPSASTSIRKPAAIKAPAALSRMSADVRQVVAESLAAFSFQGRGAPVAASLTTSLQGYSGRFRGTLVHDIEDSYTYFPIGASVAGRCLEQSGDATAFRPPRFFTGAHTAAVNALVLSSTGDLLASCQEGSRPTIALWDPKTGTLLARLSAAFHGFHGQIQQLSMCFSNSGRYLHIIGKTTEEKEAGAALLVMDCNPAILRAQSVRAVNADCATGLRAPAAPLKPLMLLPKMLTQTLGQNPLMLAMSSRSVPMQTEEHNGSMVAIAFADAVELWVFEDAPFAVISRVRIDIDTTSVAKVAKRAALTGSCISSVCFSAPVTTDAGALSLTLYAGMESGVMTAIDVSRQDCPRFSGAYLIHDGAITSISTTLPSQLVATADTTGSVRLWPADFSECLLEADHPGAIATVLGIGGDSQPTVLISCSNLPKGARLSDIGSITSAATYPLRSFASLGTLDLYAQAYRVLVRGHGDKVIAACEHATQIMMSSPQEDGADEFPVVAVPALQAVTTSFDGSIRVYHMTITGEPWKQVYEFSSVGNTCLCVDVHPCTGISKMGSGVLACGFGDGIVRIFLLEETQLLHSLVVSEKDVPVVKVAYSPCGRFLYAATQNGKVVQFDALTYAPLRAYTQRDPEVAGKSILSISADGSLLALTFQTMQDGAKKETAIASRKHQPKEVNKASLRVASVLLDADLVPTSPAQFIEVLSQTSRDILVSATAAAVKASVSMGQSLMKSSAPQSGSSLLSALRSRAGVESESAGRDSSFDSSVCQASTACFVGPWTQQDASTVYSYLVGLHDTRIVGFGVVCSRNLQQLPITFGPLFTIMGAHHGAVRSLCPLGMGAVFASVGDSSSATEGLVRVWSLANALSPHFATGAQEPPVDFDRNSALLFSGQFARAAGESTELVQGCNDRLLLLGAEPEAISELDLTPFLPLLTRLEEVMQVNDDDGVVLSPARTGSGSMKRGLHDDGYMLQSSAEQAADATEGGFNFHHEQQAYQQYPDIEDEGVSQSNSFVEADIATAPQMEDGPTEEDITHEGERLSPAPLAINAGNGDLQGVTQEQVQQDRRPFMSGGNWSQRRLQALELLGDDFVPMLPNDAAVIGQQQAHRYNAPGLLTELAGADHFAITQEILDLHSDPQFLAANAVDVDMEAVAAQPSDAFTLSQPSPGSCESPGTPSMDRDIARERDLIESETPSLLVLEQMKSLLAGESHPEGLPVFEPMLIKKQHTLNMTAAPLEVTLVDKDTGATCSQTVSLQRRSFASSSASPVYAVMAGNRVFIARKDASAAQVEVVPKLPRKIAKLAKSHGSSDAIIAVHSTRDGKMICASLASGHVVVWLNLAENADDGFGSQGRWVQSAVLCAPWVPNMQPAGSDSPTCLTAFGVIDSKPQRAVETEVGSSSALWGKNRLSAKSGGLNVQSKMSHLQLIDTVMSDDGAIITALYADYSASENSVSFVTCWWSLACIGVLSADQLFQMQKELHRTPLYSDVVLKDGMSLVFPTAHSLLPLAARTAAQNTPLIAAPVFLPDGRLFFGFNNHLCSILPIKRSTIRSSTASSATSAVGSSQFRGVSIALQPFTVDHRPDMLVSTWEIPAIGQKSSTVSVLTCAPIYASSADVFPQAAFRLCIGTSDGAIWYGKMDPAAADPLRRLHSYDSASQSEAVEELSVLIHPNVRMVLPDSTTDVVVAGREFAPPEAAAGPMGTDRSSMSGDGSDSPRGSVDTSVPAPSSKASEVMLPSAYPLLLSPFFQGTTKMAPLPGAEKSGVTAMQWLCSSPADESLVVAIKDSIQFFSLVDPREAEASGADPKELLHSLPKRSSADASTQGDTLSISLTDNVQLFQRSTASIGGVASLMFWDAEAGIIVDTTHTAWVMRLPSEVPLVRRGIALPSAGWPSSTWAQLNRGPLRICGFHSKPVWTLQVAPSGVGMMGDTTEVSAVADGLHSSAPLVLFTGSEDETVRAWNASPYAMPEQNNEGGMDAEDMEELFDKLVHEPTLEPVVLLESARKRCPSAIALSAKVLPSSASRATPLPSLATGKTLAHGQLQGRVEMPPRAAIGYDNGSIRVLQLNRLKEECRVRCHTEHSIELAQQEALKASGIRPEDLSDRFAAAALASTRKQAETMADKVRITALSWSLFVVGGASALTGGRRSGAAGSKAAIELACLISGDDKGKVFLTPVLGNTPQSRSSASSAPSKVRSYDLAQLARTSRLGFDLDRLHDNQEIMAIETSQADPSTIAVTCANGIVTVWRIVSPSHVDEQLHDGVSVPTDLSPRVVLVSALCIRIPLSVDGENPLPSLESKATATGLRDVIHMASHFARLCHLADDALQKEAEAELMSPTLQAPAARCRGDAVEPGNPLAQSHFLPRMFEAGAKERYAACFHPSSPSTLVFAVEARPTIRGQRVMGPVLCFWDLSNNQPRRFLPPLPAGITAMSAMPPTPDVTTKMSGGSGAAGDTHTSSRASVVSCQSPGGTGAQSMLRGGRALISDADSEAPNKVTIDYADIAKDSLAKHGGIVLVLATHRILVLSCDPSTLGQVICDSGPDAFVGSLTALDSFSSVIHVTRLAKPHPLLRRQRTRAPLSARLPWRGIFLSTDVEGLTTWSISSAVPETEEEL
jgi:WD40 repeat protein